jgi:ABC-type multidrug transport system ATPase subunit
MDHGHIVAMGTSDEIIAQHGSGERLEIHGTEELAHYIKANTELQVEYDRQRSIISIPLKQKIDALSALAAADQSKMDYGEIQTRRDSLDDVFVKLVSGRVDEHGEIISGNNENNRGAKK